MARNAKYDAVKDVTIVERERQVENGWLVASIKQYDGGEKKIQLARRFESDNNRPRYAKLGRLNANELVELNELLKEMTVEQAKYLLTE